MAPRFVRPRWDVLAGSVLVIAMTFVALGLARQAGSTSEEAGTAITPIESGSELMMVFLATSTCPGIDDPDLREAVALVRDQLTAEARATGKTFVSVGISLDWDVEQGFQFLQEWGPFDEVLVGRSWLNSGAVRYMWQDFPGVAAVPQLIIMERSIEKDRAIAISDERVKVRKAGGPVIAEWAFAAYGRRAVE